MAGQTINFSAADLAAAAAGYDPAKWKAPIVVGHPIIDAPAYGWVAGVRDEAGELYADADQVEAQFAELVREGRFKKVSASWFTPSHPRNPTPGNYYLKHLGFLGAAAPAVSGLRPVEFVDDDSDAAEVLTIEFSVDSQEAGSTAADIEAGQKVPASPITPEEPPTVTPEEAAALKAQNEALAAQVDTLNAEKKETTRLALHAEHASFAEGLVKAGRMVPGIAPLIVATLDHLAGSEPPMFGEGDAAQPLPAALKAALSSAPVVIDFSERGAEDGEAAAATASFAAPDGYQADAAALDLHRRAQAYQAANKTDYLTAVKAVSKP